MDEKLRTVFGATLDLSDREVAELSEKATIHTVSNWDSLGHIKLILALEKEYGISISDSEAIQLVSVERILLFLNGQMALGGRS